MEIIEISFKKINRKLYLFIYYDNGEIKKTIVKDKYKNQLFYLITDINILDKYK